MKKLFILVFMLTFSLTLLPKSNARPNTASTMNCPVTTMPIGDLNCDGNVNSADAVQLINWYYSGTPLNAAVFDDFYTDNVLDMNDIVILIGFVQGRVPTLPVYPVTPFNQQYPETSMTPVISLNGLPWVALPPFSLWIECSGAQCMQPPPPLQP